MTRLLHRIIHKTLPIATGAEGVTITDAEGRSYIDASGGAAVSCLGHGHPDVLAAMHEQIDRIAYAHTALLHHRGRRGAGRPPDRATRRRASAHVYLVSGGSEAVEAALKLARQYFVEIGEPQRRHFIARRQSYHGNTLGALAVGGNEWRRAPVRAAADRRHHVAPCYAYRDRRPDESDGGLRRAPAAGELEDRSVELGRRERDRLRRRDRWSARPRRGAAGAGTTSAACARSATATASC